ncbi:MAG: hypothetical protein ACU0BF_10665 [Paracoccaceae bacterium]
MSKPQINPNEPRDDEPTKPPHHLDDTKFSKAPAKGPGKTKYDVPAQAADDFAQDEHDDKKIRGVEDREQKDR